LRDMLAHVIALAQERLSAQESFVLFSRYGIDGHRQEIGTAGSPTSKRVPLRKAEFKHDEEGKSLAEIGQLIGITRERVRQIEAKALGKIRRLIRQRYPEIDRLCQQGRTTADNGLARSVH